MRLIIVGTLMVLVLIFLAFQALPARAHSFYSSHCCSGQDCAPASAGTVTWTPAGWSVGATGEVVPFDDFRIKYTPPGVPQFHICIIKNAAKLRCLYVPEPQI